MWNTEAHGAAPGGWRHQCPATHQRHPPAVPPHLAPCWVLAGPQPALLHPLSCFSWLPQPHLLPAGAPQGPGAACASHTSCPQNTRSTGSFPEVMLLPCEGQALGCETRTGDQCQSAGCSILPSCKHPRPTAQSTALCKLGWSQNIKPFPQITRRV